MPTTEPVSAHLLIKGRVQGVGYRFFAQDTARALGLKGWVCNCPNGDVEAEVEGLLSVIDEWLVQLRKGPLMARVEALDVTWIPANREFSQFSIR